MAWKDSEAEEDTFSVLNWQNSKSQMLVSPSGGNMDVEGHCVYKGHTTEMNHVLQSRENAGGGRIQDRHMRRRDQSLSDYFKT